MKFLCPNCKAKYQIADEKVAGRTLRMDCRRCGHNITIRAEMALAEAAEGAAPSRPAPAAGTAAGPAAGGRTRAGASGSQGGFSGQGSVLGADFRRTVGSASAEPGRTTPLDQWHVAINDVPVGPLRRDEIVKKMGLGAITANSLCWREGFDDWRPIRDVPELAALLRRSAIPEPLRPAPPAAPTRPTGATRPSAGTGARGASASTGPQRLTGRSNVVPIGGRLGASAAPTLDEDELSAGEPTRVGAVDLSELEARARAAEEEARRTAEAARAEQKLAERKLAEAKAAEARALEARGGAAAPLPPTGRPQTGKTATDLGPVPRPMPATTRPESVKTGPPRPQGAPETVREAAPEAELAFDEPVFASPPGDEPAPASNVASVAPAAAVQPLSPPRGAEAARDDERRRGPVLTVPAMIAIAGATAFGGVLAFMVGQRMMLAPATAGPASATAAVQPAVPDPPASPPPEPAPEQPPAAEANPQTPPAPDPAAPERPPTTPGAASHARPHASGSASPSAQAAGQQAATKAAAPTAPSGRFADFADSEDDRGPARIGTSGVRSLVDRAEGGTSPGARGQTELTPDQLRAVITRERPAVNRCWESELRRLGQAATVRLDVDLTIGSSGTVTSVTTRGQSVGTLAECIERNVRRWRFPPTGGTTQTSFPLVFTGTE